MRTIALITGSRGEYGYIRPVIRAIEEDPDLDYRVIATNLHLLPDYGYSLQEFERDGIRVSDRLYMALDGYTPGSMSKSLGVFLLGVTDALLRLEPDIVLLAGDRGEQLMAAIAAAHMNIPVAHIQAGELSGNIDGMTRHAIGRYAHVHFASNADAAERLRRSGEQEFRIFLSGAPQLDELVNGEYDDVDTVRQKFSLRSEAPLVLVVQHPVTEEFLETEAQVVETMEAVCELGHDAVVIFPNNDAGSSEVRRVIEQYRRPFVHIHRSVPRRTYLGLMRAADVMVGNSSSALIEAPVFRLPAVNVGHRQRDRYRGPNVIDVESDRHAIEEALGMAMSPDFKGSLAASDEAPYLGDGHVAERITQVLRELAITEHLLKKQLAY